MDTIFTCIICFLVTCILITILTKTSRSNTKNLPPGPTPLPIIGNLFKIGDKPHKSLAKLANIHGPIMTLQLGQLTTVVISSANLAKEILRNHDVSFSNRTVPDAVTAQQHHAFSMALLPVSPAWRNLRKISNLYVFSSQKLDANEYLRREKIQQMLDYVKECSREGRAVYVGQAAFNATMNFLSSSVFSLDLADPNSETVRSFRKLVTDIMEVAGRPNLADYFPLLKKIDPSGIRHRLSILLGKMFELLDQLIEERLKQRENRDYSSKDVLDTLLNLEEEDSPEEINKDYLKHMLLDFFVAGTDSTSSTLEWTMAELLRKPEVLRKARMELEQTIGKLNRVEESDVSRLPYLQAIVKETLRLHPALPLLLPRKAAMEVEIAGYRVPEGVQVLVNAWAIGRDGEVWENPTSFCPERFMGSDVDFKGRNFELIPFGAGRRICPGMPLANRMLHLMLGSLIYSFDWKLEDGVEAESLDMDDVFGLTVQRAVPLRAVPTAIH